VLQRLTSYFLVALAKPKIGCSRFELQAQSASVGRHADPRGATDKAWNDKWWLWAARLGVAFAVGVASYAVYSAAHSDW
jgi:hypothetical protein